jgi:GDPmannose 4,6-dehydratase
MLQQPEPKDYVIGTGQSHSVGEFVVQVLAALNGSNGNGKGATIEDYIEVDPRLLRTGEIHDLRADATAARRQLGWQPEVDFPGLVRMMVEADARSAQRYPGVLEWPQRAEA